ncbi:MAG: hypothetical protein NTV86_15760 [Planctomycetota bacterium]|nr:hypothetical protein [Planctomycetota bacterium]
MNRELSQPSSARGPGSTAAAWLACFVVTGGLYFFTCQRGVGWQDSALFQWRVVTGDYQGRLGLALSHPLYVAAGQVVLWLAGENLPRALSFFSGIGMAAALANLMCVVTLLTGRRWVGLAIAGMLAVAHTPWWLATSVKTEAWAVTGLTAELWLLIGLVRRPRWGLLAALALVSGLDWTVHNFALLPLPIYVGTALWLVVRKKLPAWSMAVAGGAYILGASLYLVMIVRYALETGSIEGAISSALWGNYRENVLNAKQTSAYFKENAALTAMNFVGVLGPLAAVGWARMKPRLGGPMTWILGAITLVEAGFFVRYSVPDQFLFGLPTLFMMALAAGIGLNVVCELSPRWRTGAVVACAGSMILAPVFYAAAPHLAAWVRPGALRHRNLPYRDEARYWLVPWKQDEDSADRFAREAFAQAGSVAVIVPDVAVARLLGAYGKIHPECAGVTVQVVGAPLPAYDRKPVEFRRVLGDRPLFVTMYENNPAAQAMARDAAFDQKPGEMLCRVIWKAAGTQTAPAPSGAKVDTK